VAPNVHLLTPLIVPFHGSALVRKLNRWLLRKSIGSACRSVGFSKPILWLVLPHFASIIRDVDARALVYYCVDEYASQPNVDAVRISGMEEEVLAAADVVFAVSEHLVEKKRISGKNVYLSTHGVGVEHFAAAQVSDQGLPPDMAGIKQPIAGFFGLIEDWIDLELIAFAAKALPEVSFVMIGRVVQPLGSLEKLDNVHFLGQKSYEDLPGYLRGFAVGLLPYKLNEQVINSNPKKLREYLAGGKPVVSVRVREVERYANLVRIADSPEQFVQAISESIEQDNDKAVKARMEAVAEESWRSRVELICSRVEAHIPEKGQL